MKSEQLTFDGPGASNVDPLLTIPHPSAESTASFRPIQYLGSKSRSMAGILDAVRDLSPGRSTVLDLFSGTSVVAQGLAAHQHRVLATDAMEFCCTFARALLGVGRVPSRTGSAELVTKTVRAPALPNWADSWGEFLRVEQDALGRRDPERLLDLSRNLPQVWRPDGAGADLSEQFRSIEARVGQVGFSSGNIVTTHYAGTYFGLRQAIDIDVLRVEIAELRAEEAISSWEEAALMTALLSTVSDCVFSPGKHFAQSYNLRDSNSSPLIRSRILQDRQVDVRKRFRERLTTVLRSARPGGEGHDAKRLTLEEMVRQGGMPLPIDVIYADPPYTAQQYSRFYHIPEILASYVVPRLEKIEGRVTRGLYPLGRFKSRFSSKRQTPAAFGDLMRLATAARRGLIVSYSATSSGKTGNDRMITFDALWELSCQVFGRKSVSVKELSHSYRQFNSEANAVGGRLDRELLLTCRADA